MSRALFLLLRFCVFPCLCAVQVALLWLLDFVHTVMACIANWVYLVKHFGDRVEADHITWSIPVTVALTVRRVSLVTVT